MDPVERHEDGSVTIHELGVYEISTGPRGGYVWELILPYGKPPLSGNSRWGHWSQEREVQAGVKKAVWALARHQRIPQLTTATVELVWLPGTNRRYDADNIAPTLKPAIDGLVAAGVLPDDDSNRVLRTGQRVILRKHDPQDSALARVMLIVTGTPV